MKAVGELWTFFLLNKERQMAQAPWGGWRDKGRGGKRVGKKKSLGQVYLAVMSDTGGVLIARKNWYWKGGSTFLNNAGQWVFPGGGVEEGEDRASAAIREFREETNVDLTQYSTSGKLYCFFKEECYSLYVFIVDEDSFKTILALVTKSLFEKSTKDPELIEVKAVAAHDLDQYLGKRISPDTSIKGYDPSDRRQSIDWYESMARALKLSEEPPIEVPFPQPSPFSQPKPSLSFSSSSSLIPSK